MHTLHFRYGSRTAKKCSICAGAVLPTLTDPRAPQTSLLDRVLKPVLRDERDVSLARTTVLLVPLGFLLIAANFAAFSWWTVAAFWAFYLYFMGPCTLGMHNIAHRPMFKSRRWDNWLIGLMGACFGHAPGTYPGHHLSMHHREENGPDDLSSTMDYQRDSVLHFGHYVGRFLGLGLVDLARYLFRNKRRAQFKEVLVGEFGWIALCIGLAFVHLEAALACFIVPTIATRFLLMAGNWAQHAFIDPDDWENPYRSITTFVNSGYNARCYNDGYHLNHHLRSSSHWTELPERFEAIQDEVVAQRAIVFHSIDYFVIWALLMMKRHRFLAKYMVDFGEPTTIEDRVALLRHRLQPVPAVASDLVAA